MIKRLLVALALVAGLSADASAQNWTIQNGSSTLACSNAVPCMVVNQNGTGKIVSFRRNGTEIWAIDFGAGGVGATFFANGLATTSTDGIVLSNATLSTAGTTVQMSPRIKWLGSGWDTDDLIARSVRFGAQALPSSGTTVAGTWELIYLDPITDAITKPLTVTGAGALTTLGTIASGNRVTSVTDIAAGTNVVAGQTGVLGWASTRSLMSSPADGQMNITNAAVTAGVGFDVATDSTLKILTRGQADTATVTANVMKPTSPAITAGSGTGVTVNNTGELRDPVYKVTVLSTQFIANAVTADFTIATLPANTRLLQVDASLTTTFACASVCTTGTLSMVLGKGAGGAEYLASFDVDAATAWFGDADAEMGTLMTRAAAINSGTFTAGSQAVVVRLTSGTGNVGNGAATNLSQGSVTFYLHTLTMP